jgi:hypothetical protein
MNTIEVLRSRPGYLGVVEAAEFIDIHRDTLCDWINAGKLGDRIPDQYRGSRRILEEEEDISSQCEVPPGPFAPEQLPRE